MPPYYMLSARRTAEANVTGARPRYLRSDDGQTYAEMNPAAWVRDVMETLNRQNPGDTPSGEVLFFVHGYNVGEQAAKNAHLKCVRALAARRWNGVLISYDWPSQGLSFAYLLDRARARMSAELLISGGVRLLRQAQTPDCTVSINLLCHSMGVFVAEHAFKYAPQDVAAGWSVDQALLVAGDVGMGDYMAGGKIAERFDAHAGRVTVYNNLYDKALAISGVKRRDFSPRLGRSGLPADAPDLFCGVDCSPVFAREASVTESLDPVKSHCFYFDNDVFWQDAVLTLAGGTDRSVIPTRELAAPNRFVLRHEPLSDDEYSASLRLAQMSADRRLRLA